MNNRNIGSQTGRGRFFAFYLLPFAFLFTGCSAFDVGSKFQRGRYSLQQGEAKAAVADFQSASQIDANYSTRIGPMKEGVWTYLGRAYYASGDYKAAIKALEQARTTHPDDSFAPMYLGLALAQDNDRQRGAKELQTGLTGLHDWLEYITQYDSDKAYWDPGAYIRNGIKIELARLDGKEVDWNNLIAGVERVGIALETEAEKVANDKRREQRDSSRGDGGM